MTVWIPLRIANATKTTPQLLVNAQFSSTGYIVNVTDLSQLWTEELDRRQLIRRALNDNTSIDPSEDPSQLRILLAKIEEALNGDYKTSLQISAQGDDGLLLHVHCALPPPLHHLEWRIELGLQPQESVRTKVAQPLVERLGALDLQEEALLRLIHDKDLVINKLLDKLESTGADISDVFPGVTGNRTQRKAISRAQAAQHVKGLGKFDEHQWLEQARKAQDGLPHEELYARVFKLGKVSAQPKPSDYMRRGWQNELATLADSSLSESLSISRDDKEPAIRVPRETHSPTSPPNEDDNGDFQRQNTPPSAQKWPLTDLTKPSNDALAIQGTKNPATTDSGTESDDDDLDAPVSKWQSKMPLGAARSSPEPRLEAPRTQKLGQIGGKRRAADASIFSKEQGVVSSVPSPRAPLLSPEPNTTKPKARLGMIGGRRPPRDATPERTRPDSPTINATPSKVHSRKGGSKQTSPVTRRTAEATEYPPAGAERRTQVDRVEETQLHPAVQDEDPPESSQDRADRKREELKRQLESKAQAPAKKKRRF